VESIIELSGRFAESSRAANHLLASMGDRKWMPRDQAAFDGHIASAEAAKEKLDALLYNTGHQDSIRAQQREGFELFLRKSLPAMSAAERRKLSNAMSTTVGSQGGYTVSTMVAAQIVTLLKGYGWMRQVASQISTSNGADLTVPTSDGTAEVGELVGQNVGAASQDPSFAAVAMPTYRFSSKAFTVPIELLQDAAMDIVAFFLQRARDRIGRTQNALFTTGTGTGQPTGIITAASVGKVGTTGQTLTIIYDDLVDLADSVDEGHLGMPSSEPGLPQPAVGWMMPQSMRKVVRKLKDTNGRPIWTPGRIEGKVTQPAQLLDYPVYINNDMAAPAANAKTVAFGNLGSYTVRDALDVVMFRFDDSAFTSKGQVGFVAFARAGGNLLDAGAVKTYQHSAT
jgi:HK97 family phage major capsid protein